MITKTHSNVFLSSFGARSVVAILAKFAMAALLATLVSWSPLALSSELRAIVIYDKKSAQLGQNYRMEIFPDGQAVYVGREKVKMKDRIDFKITPEGLAALSKELAGSNVMGYVIRPGRSAHTSKSDTRIILNLGEKTREIELNSGANTEFVLRLEEIFEKYAPTKKFRCPYVFSSGAKGSEIELCSLQDEAARLYLKGEKK